MTLAQQLLERAEYSNRVSEYEDWDPPITVVVRDEHHEENLPEAEYHLTDMNHRFEAIKRLGISNVLVDPL